MRRLLALKRHEQPPPGYFNDFSRQDVMARIRAGEREAEASGLEWLFWEAPWLRRVWALFETKPILVGAFGAAICALLLSGLNYAEHGDAAATALLPLPESSQPAQASEVAGDHSALPPLLTTSDSMDLANTGRVINVESRSSLFHDLDQNQKPWVVPASYQAGSGN